MIEEAGVLALRKGKWKLIRGKKGKKRAPAATQLFDLSKDIGEQNNIAKQHPEVVQELDAQLQKLIDSGRVRGH